VFQVEGEKLVHYQKGIEVGVPDSIIVRERVDDDTMTVVSEIQPLVKNIDVLYRYCLHLLTFLESQHICFRFRHLKPSDEM